MVSTGKAGSIETALQGHGNIRGSGSSNGIHAVSRQALLCMWTITLIICGSMEHLYLWVYIVRTPWS